jgi:hypothetical protein
MKKTFQAILLLLLQTHYTHAQTKVFKEVNDEISSQLKTIHQDGSLVGYLVFTQLEKASSDSFNYKITIMDENLNDIGAINFKQQKLNLQAVSFESDVLCLAYLKSNIIDNEFKNKKEYRNALPNAHTAMFTQFLSLNGKIVGSSSIPAEVKLSNGLSSANKTMGEGKLKHNIQLRNLPQKGFACFYGDDIKNNLLIFNTAGKQVWQTQIKDQAEGYGLMSSSQDVYILLKKKEKMLEGGYELLGYDTKDSTTFLKYVLKDKRGNSLKVLGFDNDPSTGKLYITGNIISQRKGNYYASGKQLARGPYSGVFTINLNGHKKADIKEVYSYWSDGSQPTISKRGLYTENRAYARWEQSFKDYQGNTYFAGSSFIKRARWGSIISSVITAPLIFPPLFILGSNGTQKCKIKDAFLLKQSIKGELVLENSIKGNNSKFYPAYIPTYMYNGRSFYSVTNSDTKTNYLILDDVKDIVIYNVNQQKILRTIHHKDGNIRTSIFPANEGHVMVSEYNKKEKSTRLSIETL